MSNFGEYGLALEARDAIKKMVGSEIKNQMPPTRLAQVVSVDSVARTLGVTFTGETNVVQVPYVSELPANLGQYVRIGGSTHDRYVEAVIGETLTQRRVEKSETNINALMQEVVGPAWADEDPDSLPTNVTDYFAQQQVAIQESIDATAAAIDGRIDNVQEIFSVISSRSLADGLDPTGESTFRYECLQVQTTNGSSTGTSVGHDHSIPSLNVGMPFIQVNSGLTLMGWIRQGILKEKSQATFICYKSGTVTDFRVAVHFMNRTTGVVTRHWVSANLEATLITTPQWQQIVFPDYTPEEGDLVGFEFSMAGSGFVAVAGIKLVAPLALPGFRPVQMGAIKPFTGISTSYTDLQMQEWASGFTPYVQVGSDIGQVGSKRSFVDNFNRTTGMGPNWILRMLVDKTVNLSLVKPSGGVDPDRYVDNTAFQAIETWADGQWVQPLATDDVGCVCLMWGTNNVAPSVLILNGNGGFSSWVQFAVWGNKCRIYSCTKREASGWTQRAEVGIGCDSGQWTQMRFTYESATRTYRGYKNGALIISWVDSGNIMPIGVGYRYPGIAIDHFNFNTGPFIDNWAAYDI